MKMFQNFSLSKKILGNPSLKKKCRKVARNLTQTFKLTSKHFSYFTRDQIDKINNYSLTVNCENFRINFELFCCISSNFLHNQNSSHEFECSIPNQHFQCFTQFMNLFKIGQFQIIEYQLPSLWFLNEFFGFRQLKKLISSSILFPQNFDHALTLLSKPILIHHKSQFDQSIEIFLKNLQRLNEEHFHQLHNFSLINLFSSPQFQIWNENQFFQMIIKMIKTSYTRKALLKTVRYPYVSSDLLKSFFQDFSVHEVDIELFEALKERLFSDVAKPTFEIPAERWIDSYNFLSREEIDEIFQILHNYFRTNKNPVQLIQKIIQDINELKSQISNLGIEKINLNIQLQTSQNEIENFKKEIEQMNRQNPNEFSNQNSDGIIESYLTQIEELINTIEGLTREKCKI